MNLFLASKKNKKWLRNCKYQIKLKKTKIYIFYGLGLKRKSYQKYVKRKLVCLKYFLLPI